MSHKQRLRVRKYRIDKIWDKSINKALIKFNETATRTVTLVRIA